MEDRKSRKLGRTEPIQDPFPPTPKDFAVTIGGIGTGCYKGHQSLPAAFFESRLFWLHANISRSREAKLFSCPKRHKLPLFPLLSPPPTCAPSLPEWGLLLICNHLLFLLVGSVETLGSAAGLTGQLSSSRRERHTEEITWLMLAANIYIAYAV